MHFMAYFKMCFLHYNDDSVVFHMHDSRVSAVDIATSNGLDDQEFGFRVPVSTKDIEIYISSRPALGPTQGASGTVKLATDPQLVPRPRKRGYIHALSHIPSWRSA
jgi:hypothetical protein